jgi:hypothetical protein
MSVTDIVLIAIIGTLSVLCIGGWIYCEWIEPLRVKLALAEHFPMFDDERHTFIENSKIVRDKHNKVRRLKESIDRLEEETKYLTGADLLIVKSAIERLKMEYAEVNADYQLSKKTFESYKQMFYTLYPFSHSCDYEDDTPLKKEEILYKKVKNSIDN